MSTLVAAGTSTLWRGFRRVDRGERRVGLVVGSADQRPTSSTACGLASCSTPSFPCRRRMRRRTEDAASSCVTVASLIGGFCCVPCRSLGVVQRRARSRSAQRHTERRDVGADAARLFTVCGIGSIALRPRVARACPRTSASARVSFGFTIGAEHSRARRRRCRCCASKPRSPPRSASAVPSAAIPLGPVHRIVARGPDVRHRCRPIPRTSPGLVADQVGERRCRAPVRDTRIELIYCLSSSIVMLFQRHRRPRDQFPRVSCARRQQLLRRLRRTLGLTAGAFGVAPIMPIGVKSAIRSSGALRVAGLIAVCRDIPQRRVAVRRRLGGSLAGDRTPPAPSLSTTIGSPSNFAQRSVTVRRPCRSRRPRPPDNNDGSAVRMTLCHAYRRERPPISSTAWPPAYVVSLRTLRR